MSDKSTTGYESPEVTEYGSVEAVTEQQNKYTIGTDTDISAINLEGSVGFQ